MCVAQPKRHCASPVPLLLTAAGVAISPRCNGKNPLELLKLGLEKATRLQAPHPFTTGHAWRPLSRYKRFRGSKLRKPDMTWAKAYMTFPERHHAKASRRHQVGPPDSSS
eukprot:4072545-Amphidinium_carterae.1